MEEADHVVACRKEREWINKASEMNHRCCSGGLF